MAGVHFVITADFSYALSAACIVIEGDPKNCDKK